MFNKSIKKLEEQKNDIFLFEILFFIFFFAVVSASLFFTEVNFWGDKTDSMFDVWFLQHILSGMILSFMLKNYRYTRKYSLLIVITAAYSWEFVEFFLETDSHAIVMNWMAGLEHPVNRFAIDPIAGILGYILINRFSGWIYLCLALNFCFAVLHLLLGDSMAIQQFLY